MNKMKNIVEINGLAKHYFRKKALDQLNLNP